MSHSFPYLFASYRSLFHHCRPDSPSVHCTPYWNRCTLPTCTCTVEESRWAEAWGTSCPPRPNHPNSRSVRRRCRKSRCRLRYCRWTGCCCRYHTYSATHRCHLRSHSRDHSYRRVVINYLPDNRICLETSKRISTFIQSHMCHTYWKGMRMQSPLAQANSFMWQVRLGQFWSSSAALAQSFSPSHTKLKGTQRGWPGYQVGQVNWSELQVRWPPGDNMILKSKIDESVWEC